MAWDRYTIMIIIINSFMAIMVQQRKKKTENRHTYYYFTRNVCNKVGWRVKERAAQLIFFPERDFLLLRLLSTVSFVYSTTYVEATHS